MADRAVLKMAKAAPQDLEILGTTENAVRIQISSAIIAYCLVAIVQHDLQLKRSTYEVLQILSISLMDKTPLVDLFERTDFNNVKELGCPLFPIFKWSRF